MIDVVTYQAHITHGLKVAPWIAYVVLPDKSLWGVRFEGDSEEQARQRAIAFYEAEKIKQERIRGSSDEAIENKPVNNTGGRGQHLVGTICMINHKLKQRIRCKVSEIASFQAKGWIKGGPRTPFQD